MEKICPYLKIIKNNDPRCYFRMIVIIILNKIFKNEITFSSVAGLCCLKKIEREEEETELLLLLAEASLSIFCY